MVEYNVRTQGIGTPVTQSTPYVDQFVPYDTSAWRNVGREFDRMAEEQDRQAAADAKQYELEFGNEYALKVSRLKSAYDQGAIRTKSELETKLRKLRDQYTSANILKANDLASIEQNNVGLDISQKILEADFARDKRAEERQEDLMIEQINAYKSSRPDLQFASDAEVLNDLNNTQVLSNGLLDAMDNEEMARATGNANINGYTQATNNAAVNLASKASVASINSILSKYKDQPITPDTVQQVKMEVAKSLVQNYQIDNNRAMSIADMATKKMGLDTVSNGYLSGLKLKKETADALYNAQNALTRNNIFLDSGETGIALMAVKHLPQGLLETNPDLFRDLAVSSSNIVAEILGTNKTPLTVKRKNKEGKLVDVEINQTFNTSNIEKLKGEPLKTFTMAAPKMLSDSAMTPDMKGITQTTMGTSAAVNDIQEFSNMNDNDRKTSLANDAFILNLFENPAYSKEFQEMSPEVQEAVRRTYINLKQNNLDKTLFTVMDGGFAENVRYDPTRRQYVFVEREGDNWWDANGYAQYGNMFKSLKYPYNSAMLERLNKSIAKVTPYVTPDELNTLITTANVTYGIQQAGKDDKYIEPSIMAGLLDRASQGWEKYGTNAMNIAGQAAKEFGKLAISAPVDVSKEIVNEFFRNPFKGPGRESFDNAVNEIIGVGTANADDMIDVQDELYYLNNLPELTPEQQDRRQELVNKYAKMSQPIEIPKERPVIKYDTRRLGKDYNKDVEALRKAIDSLEESFNSSMDTLTPEAKAANVKRLADAKAVLARLEGMSTNVKEN